MTGTPAARAVLMSVPESPTMIARSLDAARSGDGLEQRLRVRLADAERVLAADEGESVGDAEFFDQELGQALDLVGADRLPPAGARERRERLVDAWIKPGAIDDMGVVIAQDNRRTSASISCGSRDPARSGEAALDQRPRAGPEQRAGAFDGQGRKAFSPQQPIERGDQVLGRVGERAVEIIDDGWSEHRDQVQKSGSAGLSRPPILTGAMALVRPSVADLGGDGA